MRGLDKFGPVFTKIIPTGIYILYEDKNYMF